MRWWTCVFLAFGPIVGRMTYRNMRSAGARKMRVFKNQEESVSGYLSAPACALHADRPLWVEVGA
jgi:hypothetical protein